MIITKEIDDALRFIPEIIQISRRKVEVTMRTERRDINPRFILIRTLKGRILVLKEW